MTFLSTLALAAIPLIAGQPDGIQIPAIGLAAPVAPAQEVMLDDGNQTWSVPCSRSASAIVQGGNISLFGHRDICGGVFDEISRLQPGDPVYYGDETYIVSDHAVVVPTEIWPIQATEDERLTLISCWPPGSTAQRYVVIAQRAPDSAAYAAPAAMKPLQAPYDLPAAGDVAQPPSTADPTVPGHTPSPARTGPEGPARLYSSVIGTRLVTPPNASAHVCIPV